MSRPFPEFKKETPAGSLHWSALVRTVGSQELGGRKPVRGGVQIHQVTGRVVATIAIPDRSRGSRLPF